MAYGTELVFELTDEDMVALLPANVATEFTAADEFYRGNLVDAAGAAVNSRLRAVHLDLVRNRFDASAAQVKDSFLASIQAQTPAGTRRFNPFCVEGFGDEHDPYAVTGISVWSRYFPVWADWRFEHGGSGDPIRFDADLTVMVDEARAALATVIPAIGPAPLTVVFCHY